MQNILTMPSRGYISNHSDLYYRPGSICQERIPVAHPGMPLRPRRRPCVILQQLTNRWMQTRASESLRGLQAQPDGLRLRVADEKTKRTRLRRPPSQDMRLWRARSVAGWVGVSLWGAARKRPPSPSAFAEASADPRLRREMPRGRSLSGNRPPVNQQAPQFRAFVNWLPVCNPLRNNSLDLATCK